MRLLSSQSDLGGLPDDLRAVVASCLALWVESEVLDDPDRDIAVCLVEPDDTIQVLSGFCDLLSALEDEDEAAPFDWVSDSGCAFEACLILSDSGAGFSLIVPKASGIPVSLLNVCTRLATPAPVAP